MGSFPETYNDLEGLTLKYEWLIFIEKALKIGSVSWAGLFEAGLR